MEKVCRKCNETKPLSHFYMRSDMIGGHVNQCKSCHADYQREYKKKLQKESGNEPRMAATQKSDYCIAFRWLKVMGYDLSKDIHQQFVEKHNLKYKNRPYVNKRKYEPCDCINKK